MTIVECWGLTGSGNIEKEVERRDQEQPKTHGGVTGEPVTSWLYTSSCGETYIQYWPPQATLQNSNSYVGEFDAIAMSFIMNHPGQLLKNI